MKLTRTDAVFSKTTMVLYFCRNKSSRIGTKLREDLLYNKREFLEPRTTGGGHLGGHNPPGRAPLQARPGGLSPPGGPADPETDAIKSQMSRKNEGERITAFREMEPPPSPVLQREARSGVSMGLQRGRSLIFIITNTSPLPIPCSSPPGVSNSFVGQLVGEELDEIHHVIELVLSGLDPQYPLCSEIDVAMTLLCLMLVTRPRVP